MQTFSKMQRNRVTQKNLGYFLAFIFLSLYCFLGDIFLFLPPLLGIMFVFFAHCIAQKRYARLIFVFSFLIWMECDRGLPLGSLIVFFIFYYLVVFNSGEFLFRKNMNYAYIVLVYLGFFLLLACLESYGEALDWKSFAGLCLYYACLEGVIIRAFKI